VLDLLTDLNPADQVAELRTTLARLTAPDAPADEPDLGTLGQGWYGLGYG